MKTLRIGFIGAGGIVRQRHIPGLQAIENVELTAVCNSTRESSERIAEEYDIPQIYEHWQDLVHSPDIDIVWIGTWPYLHCPATLEALRADKHVFCQARMAMNANEARQMLSAAQQSHLSTMLCPPPMGLKGDRFMQKLLHEDNILGDIYSIHFRAMSDHLLDRSAPITWRQREDLSGFNTLTVGIYAEVIHRWFGYAENVSAQAKTFIPKRVNEKVEPVFVTRPDIVMALSEMQNGALMRWEWSGLAVSKPESYVEAYGEKGVLRYNFDTDEICIPKNHSDWQNMDIPNDLTRNWTVEQDFIDSIRKGKEVHPNFYDGFKYMQFTEAVFRSVYSGQTVNVKQI